VANPRNLVGLLIGVSVVFLFSGLAINAVSRSAGAVVREVRRQFKELPGIMDGSQRPEYGKVVDICTRDAQRELMTPGLLAVLAPIAVGFGLGAGALASYLVGAIGAGTLMAVFLANSGGAWDNAKKMVEDGAYGGKGSPAHAATVIGDTVGDPFKDTAGPAINPLLKVMNLGVAADRARRDRAQLRRFRQHRRACEHLGRGGAHHRGRGGLQQAQADRDVGRW
jgi:K(+)-stimulated pyrophosphate-energized sodium pump